MKLKILHSADFHIGSNRSLPNYLDRPKYAFDKMIDYALSNKIDAFVIAGDIFDRKDVLRQEENLFVDFIVNLELRNINTYIIPGNHDKIDTETTTLHKFAKFHDANLFKYVHIIVDPTIITINGIKLWMVPWGHTESVFGNTNIEYDILIGHFPILNSKLPNGEKLESGADSSQLPSDKLILLGDIHLSQKFGHNIYYSGVPYQKDLGEPTDCSFNLVSLNSPSDHLVEKIKLDTYWPIIKMEITKESDIEDLPKDCWIKATISKNIPISKLPTNVIISTNKKTQDIENVEVKHDSLFTDPLSGIEDILKKSCDNIFNEHSLQTDRDSIIKKTCLLAANIVNKISG